jgi:hypothetical protein
VHSNRKNKNRHPTATPLKRETGLFAESFFSFCVLEEQQQQQQQLSSPEARQLLLLRSCFGCQAS